MPMHAMLILNFGIVFALSIIYGYLVKHRVEKFDYPPRTAISDDDDHESQAFLATQSSSSSGLAFYIYIAHLFVARIIPLLVFASIFYPAHFPNNYVCSWRPEMHGKGTSTINDIINLRHNLTIIGCTNPNGGKSETLVDAVAIVGVIIVILAVLELVYIAWVAFDERSSRTDQEFCTVYLLRKRKTIRKFVNKIRERFNGEEVFELKDDFGGIEISRLPLEHIYVNVVIQDGREHMSAYPAREFKRHEIYQSYLETPSTVTKLTNTADLFKPKKDEMKQTYPRTILVI